MPAWLKRTNTLATDIDRVVVKGVTKAVDRKPDFLLELFDDDATYAKHVQGQVGEFFERLPSRYTTSVTEELKGERKTLFTARGSPNDLCVFAMADYTIAHTGQPMHESSEDEASVVTLLAAESIRCPTFTVSFKPTGEKSIRDILKATTDQFFVVQRDLIDGSLCAIGVKDGEPILDGAGVFSAFFPRFRGIKTRVNYGFGNGFLTYRVR